MSSVNTLNVLSNLSENLRHLHLKFHFRSPKQTNGLQNPCVSTESKVGASSAVFFIDDKQVVRPNEVGSPKLIQQEAHKHDYELVDYQLEAQFRCGGSDGFINWVDNTLEVKRTANVLWNLSEPFDFRIVDSPEELDAAIRAKSTEGFISRLTAGFCWPWSQPNRDGTLVNDVRIGAFIRPWNAKPDARHLAEIFRHRTFGHMTRTARHRLGAFTLHKVSNLITWV